ncbi:MAG: hypothetical protein ACRD4A_11610 [Candidatus Acidiferrales bacterium]
MKQAIGLQLRLRLWVACLVTVLATMTCTRACLAQVSRTQSTANRVPAQTGKLATKAAKPKVGPPKIGPKVANPFAAQKNAAVIMQLDQQRKATDKELSGMKIAVRPAPGGTLLSSPSPNAGSAGTSRVPVAAPAPMPSVKAPPSSTAPRTNASAATTAPAPSPLLKPVGPGATGPERTMGSGTVSSAILRAPDPINNVALTCGHDPTMRILNVSGSYQPATFTTIKKYDEYTITGCSLGDNGPNAKVYLYKDLPKGTGFPLQFRILEWHDNWIHLDLDWNLTGLFDQDNLTLVIQRADGKQASKGGFKFYAAREEFLLPSIPRGDFSLWGLTTTNTSAWKVTYNSPALTTTYGWDFPGMTAEVNWYEGLPFMKNGFDTANMPKAGRDVYDFNRLQPGFVPTNASLQWQPSVCYAGTLYTSGNFNLTWQASQLWVDWQGQNCANVGCGGAFQPDCFGVPNSTYGLDVWVEGPRGIDPWTGLPTKH